MINVSKPLDLHSGGGVGGGAGPNLDLDKGYPNAFGGFPYYYLR
jgi:hypothetical protein